LATPTDEDKSRQEAEPEPRVEEALQTDEEDEEDESPDPVRLGILAAVLLVLISVWVWITLHPPPKKQYADIPGVSLEGLTPAQKEAVLREANAMNCDCGSATCHYDVAECRHMENTTCDVSMKLAGQIVKRVTGKDPVFTQPMPGGMDMAPASGAPAPTAPR
jgi:hypothetical protein